MPIISGSKLSGNKVCQGSGKVALIMVSAAIGARRALVRVLLTLAATYGMLLGITRDASDAAVAAAYKKVFRRTHADKGGAKEDTQKPLGAKQAWDSAKKPPGRPKETEKPSRSGGAGRSELELAGPDQVRKTFRMMSARREHVENVLR